RAEQPARGRARGARPARVAEHPQPARRRRRQDRGRPLRPVGRARLLGRPPARRRGRGGARPRAAAHRRPPVRQRGRRPRGGDRGRAAGDALRLRPVRDRLRAEPLRRAETRRSRHTVRVRPGGRRRGGDSHPGRHHDAGLAMRARLRQALQNRQVSWRAALILYAVAFAAAAALAAGWQVVRGPDGAPRQQAESLTPVTPVPVPTAPAADCGGEDDLVVATGDDISTGSVRREVFDRWNQGKKLPGDPPAKLLELSGSTDVRRAQMAALAQAGSCQYDVLVLDVAWVAEYARHGYIRPIPLSEPDRFLPGPLRAAEIDGEQYGVPFASDAPLEFRRTDVPAGGYLLQLSDREAGTINFLEMIEYGGG